MKRLAVAKTPTVLVNITDKRLAARSEAVSSVWTDNGCLRNAPEVRHQIGLPVYKPEIEKDIIVYQLIYLSGRALLGRCALRQYGSEFPMALLHDFLDRHPLRRKH